MELEALVASVLDCDATLLGADAGRGTTDGWDSVAHLNLVAAIEETYGVRFTTAQMRELATLTLLREFLGGQGIAA